VSTTFERPPDDSAATATVALVVPGGLSPSPAIEAAVEAAVEAEIESAAVTTLGALPVGSHLVMRCRKDWRTATVVRVELDKITLSVSSPTGRTYRMRRPPDAPLTFDGSIPLLGETAPSRWRAQLARYDVRW
jgi:hypothetical protein